MILTHKSICSNLNTINLKLFCNQGGIYRFRKKFKKDSGETYPLGFHRNMRVCILEINCEGTRVVIDSMFAYHFVNPGLRVEIKRGQQKMGN